MRDKPILYTRLALTRAGKILSTVLFVLAVPALVVWTVLIPRLRFHEEEERLFRAARHGNRADVERSIAAGGRVNAASPVDRKTALFRAAVFGHAEVVRVLLEHGADPEARGADGRTALEVTLAARAETQDPDAAAGLDAVAAALRAVQR